jgi:hypothetical protein
MRIDLAYPKPQRKTYVPVGRCIYCGKGPSAGKLSKEHIIPFGLSGTLILPQASCASCSKITCEIERFYLQRMIRDARIHLNLASRRMRRNKRQPPPLLIGRRILDSTSIRWDEVPKEQHPYWLPTCGFAPAGLLTNADPNHKPLVEMCLLPGQDWQARWGLQSPNSQLQMFIDSTRYARLLAKIAHAFAVATQGVDGFEPLLRDIILDNADMAHRYVGGVERDFDDRSPAPTVLHSIGLGNSAEFVLVRLRLFSFIAGTPSYVIVAGRKA